MATRFPPVPTAAELVRLYKLSAKKHLAQNYLLDMNICNKIVKKAGNLAGAHVCEVGPGPGGITRAILNRDVQKVSVIELDRRFIPGLEILKHASQGKLDIHHGDVMKFNMEKIFPESSIVDWDGPPPNLHIIGNLPFNVSTPLIIKWLEEMSNRTGAWKYGRTKLTLTFQKEVAERMVSDISKHERCRLSIMCQNICNTKIKFLIDGKSFVPPPKVDAAVVGFVPRKKPLISLPFKLVEKVVRCTFHYRQKRCIRGVLDLFPKNMPELAKEMFEIADLNPDIQCYRLGIEEVGRLCHVYDHLCKKYPFIYDYEFRSPQSIEMTAEKQQAFFGSEKYNSLIANTSDTSLLNSDTITEKKPIDQMEP